MYVSISLLSHAWLPKVIASIPAANKSFASFFDNPYVVFDFSCVDDAKKINGFDFDSTMLRIGSMNMLLHGVENPNIKYRESLSDGVSDIENRYTLILANPPFSGSLDYEATSQKLQRVVKTKKTELLFLALFLQLLRPGGRAAVIVPDGVLFGSSKAHKEISELKKGSISDIQKISENINASIGELIKKKLDLFSSTVNNK